METTIRSLPRVEENFPSPGSDRLNATMAGRDWELLVDYEATENANMRRVTVSVFQEGNLNDPVASLTGFIGRF